jgi:phosphate transport system protein
MSRIIDTGLEEQSVNIVKMGELAFETLTLSMHGYIEGRSVQDRIQELSDILLSMADKVEDEGFQLIARYQPVATDLRTIKSYMKIANDFARYGRYALDISYISDELCGLNQCEIWIRAYINEMSEKVLRMARISVDSLKKQDITLAKTVAQFEREVDKMYYAFFKKLINSDCVDVKRVISSSLMIRYLERIADHAIYVCESIVYIVTGEKLDLD